MPSYPASSWSLVPASNFCPSEPVLFSRVVSLPLLTFGDDHEEALGIGRAERDRRNGLRGRVPRRPTALDSMETRGRVDRRPAVTHDRFQSETKNTTRNILILLYKCRSRPVSRGRFTVGTGRGQARPGATSGRKHWSECDWRRRDVTPRRHRRAG